MIHPTFKDAIEKFKSGYRNWCSNNVPLEKIIEKPGDYLSTTILLPQVTMLARTSHKKPGELNEQFITSVKLALVDNAAVYKALSSLDKPDIVSADEHTKLNLDEGDRQAIKKAVSLLLPHGHDYSAIEKHLECELTVLRLSLENEKLKDFYQACFILRKGLMKFFGF